MSILITSDFLNLRKTPAKEVGNVITTMPPDTIVRRTDDTLLGDWIHVETLLSNNFISGYASQKYLLATARPFPAPVAPIQLGAVHYPTGNKTITRNSPANFYPLNEQSIVRRDLSKISDQHARYEAIQEVLDYLDVEHSVRYAPNSKNTFCNIYAYDVAYCLGAYLPRVWWTGEAIAKIIAKEKVIPEYGKTVSELNANRIEDWFDRYASIFQWRRVVDVADLQDDVNHGKLGIIVGQRVNLNNSGHIVAIVPETDEFVAVRKSGIVTSPLQSQAGAKNRKYFSGYNWWEDSQRFRKFGFWIWEPTK